MRDSNSDMFDPRTAVMDSNYSPEDGCDHCDFGFAFNDSNFSDRLLHITIFSEPIESTQSPSVVRVETFHICSPILAARSQFFYKLFSNGMRESEQRDVTLRINDSEEDAFMELLKFMYNNNLTVTTAPAVLDVLMAADKFDVPSCMKHCGRLLRNLPMTPETVLVYLDLASTILTAEAFQPLTAAAKQFYVVHYKDITKFPDENLNLSLTSVEAIISSDDLQVTTEDAVYTFVLKWARDRYPKIEERREILRTRLAKFIRFPYMTFRKLTEVLTCKEFDSDFALKVVTEAISNLSHRFVERAYMYQPVKMVEFEQPYPRCVVYMDLKRDMCASLFPSGSIRSEAFYLDGEAFYLSVECSKTIDMLEERSFRIVLGMLEKVVVSFAVDYEFAVRSKPHRKFVTKCHGIYTFTVKKTRFEISLFAMPWRLFLGKDDVHLIDDVLHLCTKLTLRGLTDTDQQDIG